VFGLSFLLQKKKLYHSELRKVGEKWSNLFLELRFEVNLNKKGAIKNRKMIQTVFRTFIAVSNRKLFLVTFLK
jgi:hypothetical protein